jgi:hypothetical protein
MSKLSRLPQKRDDEQRINITLRGEPARWVKMWKARGLVTSCSDAIIQAFRLFQERLTEFDLRKAQVENLQKRPADDG